MFAAFLILLGILIIVAAFSQNILNQLFLKNISLNWKLLKERSELMREKSLKKIMVIKIIRKVKITRII